MSRAVTADSLSLNSTTAAALSPHDEDMDAAVYGMSTPP